MNVPSKYGDQRMLPSDGSRVLVVPGWFACRVGALKGALMVVWDSVAPDPPLLVSWTTRYPVPGTAARKKLTGLATIGIPALVTGAVSEGTPKVVKLTLAPEYTRGFCTPNTVKLVPTLVKFRVEMSSALRSWPSIG